MAIKSSTSSGTKEKRFSSFGVSPTWTPLENLESSPRSTKGWAAAAIEGVPVGDGVLSRIKDSGGGRLDVLWGDRVVKAVSLFFLFFSLGTVEGSVVGVASYNYLQTPFVFTGGLVTEGSQHVDCLRSFSSHDAYIKKDT